MKSPPIYVEIHIRGEMDELWRLTQTPELHEKWDLRFTDIEYLPRPDPNQPQRFLYATRIGFGVRIAGEGETMGESDGAAGRVSALKFWSDDVKSLIREGSGYWKYAPTGDGIRFLTRYDYRTRFGVVGRVFDRLIFRPLLGWATAWSFDRLRLWIERDIHPALSMRCSIIHAVSRWALAMMWMYQGLVPKLLYATESGEVESLRAMNLFDGREVQALWIVGAVEIAIGLAMLALWRWRFMLLLNVIAMALLLLSVGISQPSVLVGQFNPVSLNLSIAALALCGWFASRDLPSARRCLRSEGESP